MARTWDWEFIAQSGKIGIVHKAYDEPDLESALAAVNTDLDSFFFFNGKSDEVPTFWLDDGFTADHLDTICCAECSTEVGRAGDMTTEALIALMRDECTCEDDDGD